MSEPALRSDAARNRQLLVEAARAAFAERGLEAPLDDIARRAGVGNATLYRRFPTRCALVAAVFAETLREVVTAADRALADSDAWAGFVGHVTFLCRLQANDRGLADLLTAAIPAAPELEEPRARAYQGMSEVIERAQASGELRPDFRHEDIVIVLMANAGLLERTGTDAPTAWQRHLSYVMAGLRAPALVPAAPSAGEEAVVNAMTTLAARMGCA